MDAHGRPVRSSRKLEDTKEGGGKMRRSVTLSIAALVIVFVLSSAVPAVGGPGALSSASPVRLAKRALKTAKKADRRSKQALAKFNGVVATNIQTVTSAPFTVVPGGVGSGSVDCPPGTVVISGGYLLTGIEASVFFDRRSANGWTVGVDNVAAGTQLPDPRPHSSRSTHNAQRLATPSYPVVPQVRTVAATADWWRRGKQRTGVRHRRR